jgi:hypothetical protein
MQQIEQRIKQAKQVMGDWFRMKNNQCEKRINEIRDFLKKNNLLSWVRDHIPPTIKHSDPILVYGVPVKVVGVFGEIRVSDFVKNKATTPETEGVEALIFVFAISSYGWLQYWWEGRWAGRYSDPYGIDYFVENLLAVKSPRLVKVVGDMLDEGVRWWERAYERALEVLLRQLDDQSEILNGMVIDLQLGG